jgi:hypothetical protein
MRGNRRSSQTTPESRRDEIAKYLRFRRHLDVFWASDEQAEWNRNRIQRGQENPVACNWEKRKRSPAQFCRAGASTNRGEKRVLPHLRRECSINFTQYGTPFTCNGWQLSRVTTRCRDGLSRYSALMVTSFTDRFECVCYSRDILLDRSNESHVFQQRYQSYQEVSVVVLRNGSHSRRATTCCVGIDTGSQPR